MKIYPTHPLNPPLDRGGKVKRSGREPNGNQVVESLAAAISAEYGRGYGKRNLFNILKFYEVFTDFQIVQTLDALLPWTHIVILLNIKEEYLMSNTVFI